MKNKMSEKLQGAQERSGSLKGNLSGSRGGKNNFLRGSQDLQVKLNAIVGARDSSLLQD